VAGDSDAVIRLVVKDCLDQPATCRSRVNCEPPLSREKMDRSAIVRRLRECVTAATWRKVVWGISFNIDGSLAVSEAVKRQLDHIIVLHR
jgi:hypothetical protein